LPTPGAGTDGDKACGGTTETVAATVRLPGGPTRGSDDEDWDPLPDVTVVMNCAGGPGTRGDRRAPPMGGDAQIAAEPCCAGITLGLGCTAVLVPGEVGMPPGETCCNTAIWAGCSGTAGERPPDGDRDWAPTIRPEKLRDGAACIGPACCGVIAVW